MRTNGAAVAAFLMIDLDRFKAVNDTLGHPVGDRLLAQVARRLQLIMSDNDLCGRLGRRRICSCDQGRERQQIYRYAGKAHHRQPVPPI